MRPAQFELLTPTTLDEAVAALGREVDGRPLAGGQSLIALMNLRLATPETLIDLGRVPELAAIDDLGGRIRIGAMARQATVERNPLVTDRAPLIAEALGHVGHWQIRTRGTIGGNLAHADPASELPAVMLALDVTYRARGGSGHRAIPAEMFNIGAYTTALSDDELLTSVEVPYQEEGEGSALVEIARVAGAYALAGAAVVVKLEGDLCSRCRVAVFAAGSRAERIVEAEQAVVGTTVDAGAVDAAVEATRSVVPGHADVHATARQRRHLHGVVVGRALRRATERALGGTP